MTKLERFWKEKYEEMEQEKYYFQDALYLALGGKLDPITEVIPFEQVGKTPVDSFVKSLLEL